jgi:drug/metabolite transporter superfamily protein YnfA
MGIDFEELMTKKSDEGLNEYLTNIEKYVPEAVYAAINELKKRGRNFTDEELETIKDKIKNKIAAQKKENEATKSAAWDKNKVMDVNAPEFYTQRAIWGFSVFFSVICGAVLLASNTNDKKAKWTVIGFGILFTIAAIFLLDFLPRNTGLTLAVNGGGSYLLTSLFWNKYLGRDTQYRSKAIWKPLIICILIFIPLVALIIYGGQQ